MDRVLKKVQKDYNIIAAHFSQKRRYIWEDLKPLLKLIKPKDRVLDAGCGNGRLLKAIKDKHVNYLGLDFSQNLLKLAEKNNPHAEFVLADLTNKDTWKTLKEFDFCCLIAVLHSILNQKDQLFVLKNIFQVLKPGGLLILTVWNLWQLKFWLQHIKQLSLKQLTVPYSISNGKLITKTINRHLYAFTKGELKKLAAMAGFTIKDIYYVKQGKKTNWLLGQNLCLIGEKY